MSNPKHDTLLSPGKVRHLTADDLGLNVPIDDGTGPEVPPEEALPFTIETDDSILQNVLALKEDGYAGVILTGPPGTGKSWYAEQIASYLANGNPNRVRFIQFHPSYQYEDFMEGFVPDGASFRLAAKHFVKMCETATKDFPGEPCVLVIDELSRSDPSRVFGEALTYIEMSRRNQPFLLASQRELVIPDNLFILATMNPMDRGVDDVDAAFERRFAKIAMEPDARQLDTILTANGLGDGFRQAVLEFFAFLQRNPNPYAKIGHAYFMAVRDLDSLRRLWDHQLHFQLEKAFRLDPEALKPIEDQWNRMMGQLVPTRDRVGEIDQHEPA